MFDIREWEEKLLVHQARLCVASDKRRTGFAALFEVFEANLPVTRLGESTHRGRPNTLP